MTTIRTTTINTAMTNHMISPPSVVVDHPLSSKKGYPPERVLGYGV
jgi:hypothetical protein